MKHYYLVVTERGFPLLNGSRLPIYWLRKVAKEASKMYPNTKVIKVKLETVTNGKS